MKKRYLQLMTIWRIRSKNRLLHRVGFYKQTRSKNPLIYHIIRKLDYINRKDFVKSLLRFRKLLIRDREIYLDSYLTYFTTNLRNIT
jgi:hypothetical protein